jgi:DNA-binding SARP family transcriptional activator/tetratricopeptide (TPR) repeat protein
MPTTTGGATQKRGRRHSDDTAAPPPLVDAVGSESVSSAPTDGLATAPNPSWSAPSTARRHKGHELVAVGPGLAGSTLRFGSLGIRPMNPLPVREAKIQAPLQRSDTLSRPRLNGWLDRAARGRLALIIGDAGFGKSTLLADWSGLTRRKTSWYRLEHDDRDWLTFIRHLVAGGREAEQGFAPETYRLLCQLGPGGPTQAELTASLAREMAAFGRDAAHGFSVILDDFHAIERSEETDPVIAALLAATGPGFSLILATRTEPALPAVRLRGRNAVNRLDDDQLRFDVGETEALFGEAYRIPLEHDVAVELVARTEGWAALLSLVRTRLEERPDPDPRALVAQLSATQGDLYDFLAEEVLVDLPPDLQEFVARLSILADVNPRTVRLVDDREQTVVAGYLADAERLGLLSRQGRGTSLRFHPLVRDFLAAKLEATIGSEELRRQHRRLAKALEPIDWLAAATHYRAANEPGAAARVVDEAVPAIIASGMFEAVLPLLDGTAGPTDRTGALILRSRIEFARGNFRRALKLAEDAAARADGPLAGTAQLNIAALEGVAGYPEQAIERAESALRGRLADAERQVAEASLLLRGTQLDGDLAAVADALRELASQQEFAGLTRYASISLVNLANVLNWLGDPAGAIKAALRAESGFDDASGSVERTAAMTARATALVHLRMADEADRVLRIASLSCSPLGRIEIDLERAALEAHYGSVARAQEAMERLDPGSLPAAYVGIWELIAGTIALRRGDARAAAQHGGRSQQLGVRDVAGKFRTDLLALRAALATGADIGNACDDVSRLADALGSKPAAAAVAVVRAAAGPGPLGPEISSLGADERHVLSIVAEEVSDRLQDLTPAALAVVGDEAAARSARWASALRMTIAGGELSRLPAADLLSRIGDADDAAFLRSQARSVKSLREPAAAAVRRLAPRAVLRDLGAVRLELGGRAAERTSRRKAMALLCFLASRTRQASTKDEALDALWPDYSPEMGLNSLHQAIYYVRRIFDPEYREGVSAGYLTFDGEVLALDHELVDSDSRRCWRLIRSTSAQDLGATDTVLGLYQSRFAIDFTYEEWATDYRETLHAAVLGRAEASIEACLAQGDSERAIRLATAMLAVDPSADAIELGLLRAYKAAGRHAAAGEQYAHYATVLREELGVEAPPYETI